MQIQRLSLFLIVWVFTLSGCAHAALAFPATTCETSSKRQTEMSSLLLEIVKEDQADRAGSYDSVDWSKVNPRDLQRRIQVAAIFAEGCFKTAADYASAAMVYQHGTTADHYYQAFLWANDAVKLGDKSQLWLTAAGLDRYLVKIGQKQLFGTQFSKDASGNWCIQPVETSFPEARRIEYVKLDLKSETANVLKGIGATQSPEDTKDCSPALRASPRGTVPGFW